MMAVNAGTVYLNTDDVVGIVSDCWRHPGVRTKKLRGGRRFFRKLTGRLWEVSIRLRFEDAER